MTRRPNDRRGRAWRASGHTLARSQGARATGTRARTALKSRQKSRDSIELDVRSSGTGRRCRRIPGNSGVFSWCHRDADHLVGGSKSFSSRVLSTGGLSNFRCPASLGCANPEERDLTSFCAQAPSCPFTKLPCQVRGNRQSHRSWTLDSSWPGKTATQQTCFEQQSGQRRHFDVVRNKDRRTSS